MKAKTPSLDNIVSHLMAGKSITVKGYKSSGDQSVADVTFHHVGYDGYINLLKQSVEALPEVYAKVLEKNAAAGSGVVRKAARDEILASLNRRLEAKPGVERFTPDFTVEDGEKLTICRVKVTDRQYKVNPTAPKSKEATICKNLLTAGLPVGMFEFKFTLYPGKYEAVLLHEEEVPAG